MKYLSTKKLKTIKHDLDNVSWAPVVAIQRKYLKKLIAEVREYRKANIR